MLSDMGMQPHPPPSAYDAYLRAYSVAMLPGRERTNVSFGGKSTSIHPFLRKNGLSYIRP